MNYKTASFHILTPFINIQYLVHLIKSPCDTGREENSVIMHLRTNRPVSFCCLDITHSSTQCTLHGWIEFIWKIENSKTNQQGLEGKQDGELERELEWELKGE